MAKKNKPSIWQRLNPLYRCKKYNIPIWQCPTFLFVLIGVFIIIAILATYFIVNLKIGDPQTVTLIVLGVGIGLIIINFIITRSFERIAEANRMKAEFINIVSHQLRGPLSNLKFSLQTLQKKRKNRSSKEKNYLEILEDNTETMESLVNNLLLVSRMQKGEIPLKEKEISLGDVTREVVLDAKSFAQASNVELILKANKNLPKVVGDPLWVKQIIENLVDNAIRYIEGGGKVEIKIKPRTEKMLFQISDTGVGIPEEEKSLIFSKFFRSKNAVKTQTQGSGLGLYIVRHLIQKMGGKIWFESTEGKGTTFYFTIPLKKQKGQK